MSFHSMCFIGPEKPLSVGSGQPFKYEHVLYYTNTAVYQTSKSLCYSKRSLQKKNLHLGSNLHLFRL